jgi:hypothetical protein
MKLGLFRMRGVAIAAPLLCLGLALLGLCSSMAQTQSQSQSGSSASPATPSDDAAAKAAERKRRYDEQRKLLEGGVVPPKEEHRRNVDPDLMFSPLEANLLVHEQVAFRLFDKGNVEVTKQGSYGAGPTKVVNFYIIKGLPTIVAAGPGTARLGVTVGNRHAEATITVYPGDKLPKDVQRTIEAIRQGGSQ